MGTVFYKWGFYSLLIVIVVTGLTVFIKNKQEDRKQIAISQVQPRNVGWGRYFREQLDLNQEQHIQFREFRQDFHAKSHKITGQMEKVREDIFKELNSTNPSSDKLDNLANKIGQLHEQLKKYTNTYYLNMKNICTPEQQKKLYTIIQVISESDFSGNPNQKKHFEGNHQMHNDSSEVFHSYQE